MFKNTLLRELTNCPDLPCFGGRLTVADIICAAVETKDSEEACERLQLDRNAYYKVLRNIFPDAKEKQTWRTRIMKRTTIDCVRGHYYRKPVQLELFGQEDFDSLSR